MNIEAQAWQQLKENHLRAGAAVALFDPSVSFPAACSAVSASGRACELTAGHDGPHVATVRRSPGMTCELEFRA